MEKKSYIVRKGFSYLDRIGKLHRAGEILFLTDKEAETQRQKLEPYGAKIKGMEEPPMHKAILHPLMTK